jgi:hypothetical protein
MPTSQSHRQLFQDSNTLDKLNLFQSLLDAGSLNSDEALALLNTIHAELEQPQGDHSAYARYAEVMEALHAKMPQVHEDVSVNWQKLRSGRQTSEKDEETLEDNPARKQNEVAENSLSKLPKKVDLNHGADNRGGKEEESEVEGKEGEEGEAEEEETEEGEEKEENEAEEKESEEGEEKEEDEVEEKESEEGEEKEEDETEEKESEEGEEKEEDETEEKESEEGEEKEEDEAEEKEESEEGEEKEKSESSETEAVEEEPEGKEETEQMATEAAEAVEESEHEAPEVEVEPVENETVEIEETDANVGGEEEPPMEIPET